MTYTEHDLQMAIKYGLKNMKNYSIPTNHKNFKDILKI